MSQTPNQKKKKKNVRKLNVNEHEEKFEGKKDVTEGRHKVVWVGFLDWLYVKELLHVSGACCLSCNLLQYSP